MLNAFEENIVISLILIVTLCITYLIDVSVPSTKNIIDEPKSAITLEKRHLSDYRHVFWPSPRPVNFVRALVKSGDLQVQGRLTHGKAIQILASRANMAIEEFLTIDPFIYIQDFMPNTNAKMILGKSIDRVTYTIRLHTWLH